MKLKLLYFLLSIPFFGVAQMVTTYNRSAWTVTASSQELISDAPNGAATKLIDGNNATYWLSEISNNYAQYPHRLVFDMQVAQPVNQIYYVPRNNTGTSAYAGSISFSDDGITFNTEIPVIFEIPAGQHFINIPTQTHRYFRITITQNGEDHTNGNGNAVTTMAEVGAIYNTSFDYGLAPFTVQAQAAGVTLDWSTTYENNSASFNITRSTDAVNFTTIGNVTASGTPSTTATYSFTDATPVTGINFYRLELVHTNATVEQSRIKNAEFPLVAYSSTQSKNLNLFYFIPAGKAVWPDFKDRIDGVFLGLQTYYKNEMIRNGKGNKTFSLVTDASNTHIKLNIVHGTQPFNYYSTNPGGGEGPAILAEVNEYMVANPSPYYGDHSQIITPAFGYNATTGIVDEQVPVYGSGRNCFSLDYPDLKWSLLGTSGPIGYAATVNIGGTAHEAGHGLNLSHNALKVSEIALLGTALMNNGNYTFGASTTSLTATDAAILNRNQVFNPNGEITYYGPNKASISSLHAFYSPTKKSIIVTGRVATTGAPVTDVAVYNDPANGSAPGVGDNKDYDAVTWTAPVIGVDSFYIEEPIAELQVRDSSLYQMKIKLIQQDGNVSDFYYPFDFANNIPEITIGTPLCSVKVVSATASSCVPATNTYSLSVVVAYDTQPTGNITVTTSKGNSINVPKTASPQTIVLPSLPSDGTQAIGVTAAFATTPSCTDTLPAAYNAPVSCSQNNNCGCGTLTITVNPGK